MPGFVKLSWDISTRSQVGHKAVYQALHGETVDRAMDAKEMSILLIFMHFLEVFVDRVNDPQGYALWGVLWSVLPIRIPPSPTTTSFLYIIYL